MKQTSKSATMAALAQQEKQCLQARLEPAANILTQKKLDAQQAAYTQAWNEGEHPKPQAPKTATPLRKAAATAPKSYPVPFMPKPLALPENPKPKSVAVPHVSVPKPSKGIVPTRAIDLIHSGPLIQKRR